MIHLSRDERIKLIFRKITSRFPTEEELDKFTQYVETVENDFESNPDIDKTKITYQRLNMLTHCFQV